MDKELQEQLNYIVTNMATKGDIEKINQRLDKHEQRFDSIDQRLTDLTAITVNLENSISQKIESLFDGYKLNHDAQWELSRKMEELERRLMALEMRTV